MERAATRRATASSLQRPGDFADSDNMVSESSLRDVVGESLGEECSKSCVPQLCEPGQGFTEEVADTLEPRQRMGEIKKEQRSPPFCIL